LTPNPAAPNAKRIGGEAKRRGTGLAFFGFLGLAVMMMLSSCSKPAKLAPELSLKGTWTTTMKRVSNCGQPTPLSLAEATFEIQEAPLLNRAASSFNLEDANVTGVVTMRLRMQPDRPRIITTGLLVGQIVRDSTPADKKSDETSSGLKLKAYVLSQEQYGAWIAKKNQSPAPPDAGEVELAILGDAVHGYRLDGEIRSNEVCSRFTHLDAVARDLTGQFGRNVPAEWTVALSLDKR
jgi:hypothetical protein